MALTTEMQVSFGAKQTKIDPFDNADYDPAILFNIKTTDGNGNAQANLMFIDERTVNASANDDLDLTSLTDIYGAAINFNKVVGVIIRNVRSTDAANTTDLTIGNASSNAFTGFTGASAHTIGPIKPGANMILWANVAAGLGTVTASNKVLRINNGSGAANTYQIAIVGRAA